VLTSDEKFYGYAPLLILALKLREHTSHGCIASIFQSV
jgi:hypothetical protein